MPLILGANSVSGYTVKNSLRFNSGSSDYLSRTPASAGNRQKFTYSLWLKRVRLGTQENILSNGSSSGTSPRGYFYFDSNNKLGFSFNSSGSSWDLVLLTTQLFRDVSAWYHIVVAIDTTQATSSERAKLYVNGSQITTLDTATYPAQNTNSPFFNNIEHNIGRYQPNGSEYIDGYMSDFYGIDGSQLTPSSFGETDTLSGIWIPKAYTGTYGTNGFYLKFANSASLGTDSSGNGNNFTVNNLTSVDQSTDTPTNNFATLNPLVNYQAYPPVLTEGNLKNTSNSNASNGGTAPSTITISSGKWYTEMKVGSNPQNGTALGIVQDNYRFNYANDAAFYNSASYNGIAYVGDGRKAVSASFTTYGSSYTTNDIIGIAVDLTNGYVYFSKNGTFQNSGVPTSGSSGTGGISITTGVSYFICCYGYSSSIQEVNFGSPNYSANSYTDGAGKGNFSYQVPSGYFSLCTANLSLYG